MGSRVFYSDQPRRNGNWRSKNNDEAYKLHAVNERRRKPGMPCVFCNFELAPADPNAVETAWGKAHLSCAIVRAMDLFKLIGLAAVFTSLADLKDGLRRRLVELLRQPIRATSLKIRRIQSICEFFKLEPVDLATLVDEQRQVARR